jgi:fucose permease
MNTTQRHLSRTILYLTFAGTGIGMALPGSVLPALLTRWQLADSQAGLLFFLAWIGTSIGALMVQPSRVHSLACGCILTAIGCLGMAFTSEWSSFLCMLVYGIGLGMTMTSISLLQSARNAERRAAELNRLNLVWSLGACLCPVLAEHSLRVANVRVIFSILGCIFALASLWVLAYEKDPVTSSSQPKWQLPLFSQKRWSLTLWPVALVVVIMLPTGIESSMGAWIAAYVQRTERTIATTVTAGTCFWLGLMLSRIIASTILWVRRSERTVLNIGLATVLVGATLLIASTATIGILPGVFLVGFGLGPVYPSLLAIALQYSENTAIFFIAGIGSAFLPWLTGIVSTSTSSLRIGLIVPLAASLLMLILGVQISARKDLPDAMAKQE